MALLVNLSLGGDRADRHRFGARRLRLGAVRDPDHTRLAGARLAACFRGSIS
jgi:hypothetical protein